MQEQASIIGNRQEQEGKNPIDDLLRKAGEDKFIDAVVKGETGQSFGENSFFKRFVPCAEAQKLIWKVTDYAPLTDDGLISKYIYTNALLAVTYNLLGSREKGEKILEVVEDKLTKLGSFSFRKNLIAEKSTGLMSTPNNAALAFAYSAFGRKEDAIKLIHGIEDHIGFDEQDGKLALLARYSTDSTDDSALHTRDSALLALAHLGVKEDLGKFRPLQLIKGIATYVPYDKETGLFKEGTASYDLLTVPNAALALACIAYEPKSQIAMASYKGRDLGYDLIKNIEKHISFNEETGFINYGKNEEFNDLPGSILLALCYMARTYDQRVRLKKIADEVLEETRKLREK